MATPVEDKLVAPPEYIHEAPIPTTHIQYINKPAYNLVDFINDNIGIMTVLCFFILVMITAWFFFRRNKENHAVECYDYSACLSTRKEYHLLTLVVYFHERRSLNNFHRDRVITFEQIAE